MPPPGDHAEIAPFAVDLPGASLYKPEGSDTSGTRKAADVTIANSWRHRPYAGMAAPRWSREEWAFSGPISVTPWLPVARACAWLTTSFSRGAPIRRTSG